MNLISFTLWGTDLKYLHGAVANAELAKTIYPGWRCVFFVYDLGSETADRLREQGALVTRFPFEGVGRYYWRHCIPDVFWRGVDRYIVRDCDSRLSERERAAVDEWVASGRTYHFMRDHPSHSVAWMQGMYGVKGYELRGITNRLRCVPDEYGGINPMWGEWFSQIPPERRLEHGEFYREHYPHQKPFPTPRAGERFVGEIFDENGTPNDDWKALLPPPVTTPPSPEP